MQGRGVTINRRRIASSRLYVLTFVRNLLRKFVVYFRADSIPTVQRPQNVLQLKLQLRSTREFPRQKFGNLVEIYPEIRNFGWQISTFRNFVDKFCM